MQTESYSVEDYIVGIRAIVAEESDDRAITRRIKPLARRLAADRSWFRDEYRRCDPDQGFGVHLLHEEENHDLAVFVLAWLPDRGTLPHNHLTWAVVAGIEGEEFEVGYDRLDDGSRPGYAELSRSGEETLRPSDNGQP